MVDKKRRCVIVAASPQADSDFLQRTIQADDFVICADGGADYLIPFGISPDLIVGDFDSSKALGHFEESKVIRLSPHKDDTDTMHCASIAVREGFEEVLILGATGGRIDHTLANLSVLLYLDKQGVKGTISDQFNDVVLLGNGSNKLHGICGKTLSVMPFAGFSAVLSYKGLYYPMDNAVVNADYPYTISNVAVEDDVEIFLHSGTALLIISNGTDF